MAKKELFDDNLQELSAFFKALGHPARLAVLQFLGETKTCMTGDISNELPLSRTTVNQHLKELKDLKLIIGDIDGVKVNYCLNVKVIDAMISKLYAFFRKIECCADKDCGCE